MEKVLSYVQELVVFRNLIHPMLVPENATENSETDIL